MVPKKMTAADCRVVRAHVDAGPAMGERGRMRADGHALTGPGSVAFQLPGPSEGGFSFGGPSEGLKSKAFVVPGCGIVGIKLEGLICQWQSQIPQ